MDDEFLESPEKDVIEVSSVPIVAIHISGYVLLGRH